MNFYSIFFQYFHYTSHTYYLLLLTHYLMSHVGVPRRSSDIYVSRAGILTEPNG